MALLCKRVGCELIFLECHCSDLRESRQYCRGLPEWNGSDSPRQAAHSSFLSAGEIEASANPVVGQQNSSAAQNPTSDAAPPTRLHPAPLAASANVSRVLSVEFSSSNGGNSDSQKSSAASQRSPSTQEGSESETWRKRASPSSSAILTAHRISSAPRAHQPAAIAAARQHDREAADHLWPLAKAKRRTPAAEMVQDAVKRGETSHKASLAKAPQLGSLNLTDPKVDYDSPKFRGALQFALQASCRDGSHT